MQSFGTSSRGFSTGWPHGYGLIRRTQSGSSCFHRPRDRHRQARSRSIALAVTLSCDEHDFSRDSGAGCECRPPVGGGRILVAHRRMASSRTLESLCRCPAHRAGAVPDGRSSASPGAPQCVTDCRATAHRGSARRGIADITTAEVIVAIAVLEWESQRLRAARHSHRCRPADRPCGRCRRAAAVPDRRDVELGDEGEGDLGGRSTPHRSPRSRVFCASRPPSAGAS